MEMIAYTTFFLGAGGLAVFYLYEYIEKRQKKAQH